MPKAVWNGVVLAESDDTVVVEGNHYFPRDSLDDRYFGDSPAHTVCPWKGLASYLDVLVDGRVNQGRPGNVAASSTMAGRPRVSARSAVTRSR